MKNYKPILYHLFCFALIVGSVILMNSFEASAGVMTMAAFIVAGSEYHGKENMDLNLRPRFFGTAPQAMGIRVIDTQGASSIKLNFFGKIKKILMPYAAGFQGGPSASRYQKKLIVEEYKAEAEYDKHDYANMILEQIVNKGGVNQNDIDGTAVLNAERTVFFDAVAADVFANFWLGDTAKTHTHAGTYPDGTAFAAGDADKFYNTQNGLLKYIMTDVYQSFVSKQTTITGWNQSTFPILYLTVSGGSVYAYESIAKRTGAAAEDRLFSFPATNATYPYEATITELNSSGFGGTVMLEKAATGDFTLHYNAEDFIKKLDLPTLTTDTAESYMNRLFRIASPELKALKDAGLLRFYVTDSVLYNYEDTLKSGVTESARKAKIDGVDRLLCDGIPLIPMKIDQLIEADFASTFPKDWIILTTPENMCMAIEGTSNFSETRFWFNPDLNVNRQRTQFKFGANYILPELIAVSYKA